MSNILECTCYCDQDCCVDVELPPVQLCLKIGQNSGEVQREVFAPAAAAEVPGMTYSMEEQWTGKYWIDGKKIYQKTVDCGAVPKIPGKSVSHGIVGLDYIVHFEGITSNSPLSGQYVMYLPHSHFLERYQVSLVLTSTAVNITPYIDTYNIYNQFTHTYVTIQYTCTNR